MDFEEFYWALGNETTYSILPKFWETRQPLEGSHRKLMRDLRLYMLVGGMPQAIDTYLKTNNMQFVDAHLPVQNVCRWHRVILFIPVYMIGLL